MGGQGDISPATHQRVYVAGPMTGYAGYNFKAFDRVSDALRRRGYTVSNPAEMDRDAGIQADSSTEEVEAALPSVKREILVRLGQVDAVVVHGDWIESDGVFAELAVADWLGLPIVSIGTMRRVSLQLSVAYKLERLSRPGVRHSRQEFSDADERKFQTEYQMQPPRPETTNTRGD